MIEHLSSDDLEKLAGKEEVSSEAQSHLKQCADCQQSLAWRQRYFTAMQGLRSLKAPSGFAQRLRTRIEAESKPYWKNRKKLWEKIWLASGRNIPFSLAGAGFAMVVLILVWPFRKEQYPTPPSEQVDPQNSSRESVFINLDDESKKEEVAITKPIAREEKKEESPLPSLANRKRMSTSITIPNSPVQPQTSYEGSISKGKVEKRSALPVDESVEEISLAKAEAVAPRSEYPSEDRAGSSGFSSGGAPNRKAKKTAESPSELSEERSLSSEPSREKSLTNTDALETRSLQARQMTGMSSMAKLGTPPSAQENPYPPFTPAQDSALRALGFIKKEPNSSGYYRLRIAKKMVDATKNRLHELGLTSRTYFLPLSTTSDSLLIEIQ